MKNKKLTIILVTLGMNLIPILIGMILVLSIKRYDLFEILTAAFGLLYIIFFLIRANRNLKLNKKMEQENTKEEVNFEKIKNFKISQRILGYSGLGLLIISGIYYLIIRYAIGG